MALPAMSKLEYLKRYEPKKKKKSTKTRKHAAKKKTMTRKDVIGVGYGATGFLKGLITATLDHNGRPVLIESDSLKVFKRVERRRHDRASNNDGSGWVWICDVPKKSSSVKRICYDMSSPQERKNRTLPLLELKPSSEAQVKPPLHVMKHMPQPKPEVKLASSTSPDLDISPPRRSSRYLTLSDLNITFSDLKSKSSRRPEPYDSFASERPDLSPPRDTRKYCGRPRSRYVSYSRPIHSAEVVYSRPIHSAEVVSNSCAGSSFDM